MTKWNPDKSFCQLLYFYNSVKLTRPAPAIDEDAVVNHALAGGRVHVLLEAVRAKILGQPVLGVDLGLEGVVVGGALHRLGLPPPDVVQLEEDAGRHLVRRECLSPKLTIRKLCWKKDKNTV